MSSLIITILSIGLFAAMVAATVSYLPWWAKDAAATESLVAAGFAKLDRAFELKTGADGDIPPPVLAEADGGLGSHFTELLGFIPQPPVGFTWSYGQRISDGSRYSEMFYFCLSPTHENAGSVGKVRGISQFKSVAGIDQYILSDQCGDIANNVPSDSFPIHATYYVVYTPGL